MVMVLIRVRMKFRVGVRAMARVKVRVRGHIISVCLESSHVRWENACQPMQTINRAAASTTSPSSNARPLPLLIRYGAIAAHTAAGEVTLT